ncbi:MAG TPA: ATP-binding cassette domain-containing protein, partial [Bacteroidales bacterium]|nr:ATP-binding cassette domain-containing protein [Bacteroidales bacterium]
GAGKSTLADLLLRFYDVTSGSIMIDGIDIRDYVIDDLRSLYSVVTQDVILFNDTIFSNIAFGLKDVSESAVHEAAKMANAYDFIMQLPDKFMTVIGDRGLTLSGGQRQRISIARAILRNADILVLDEATSAMDTESEKLVQEALDNVMKNRTSIVIAHRLSTIQHADKIIVLTAGEIVEQGSHQELLDLKGKYYDLLQIQYGR